jgi:hypothetical protein
MSRFRNCDAAPGMHWCSAHQCYHPCSKFYEQAGVPHGLDWVCKTIRIEAARKSYAHICSSPFQKAVERYRMALKDAIQNGILFDLTMEQWTRRQAEPCAVCFNLGLDCAVCANHESIRQVDRLDSDRAIGYTWDNTQSLCCRHNAVKRDGMTAEQLIELCKRKPHFAVCVNRKIFSHKTKRKFTNNPVRDAAENLAFAFPALPEQPKPPAPEPLALPFDLALVI